MGFFGLLAKSILYGTFTLAVSLLLAIVVIFYALPFEEIPSSAWDQNRKMIIPDVSYSFIKTNGIKLNVGEAGPKDGPMVLLLHGFPETGLLAWYHQIPALAKEGYHVVFPDLRGYNTSDKPEGICNYDVSLLVEDVIGLIDHFKQKKVFLVGHDWGALISWWVAIKHPNRIEKLSIMNVGHPLVFKENLSTNLKQLARLWYFFFFNLPFIPELKFERNNYELGRVILATSIPGSFTADSIPKYVAAWSQPNATSASFNYYRAALQCNSAARDKELEKDPTIHVPTILIWGKNDSAIGPEAIEPSLKLCVNGSDLVLLNATHWVQRELPEQVSQALLTWFKK